MGRRGGHPSSDDRDELMREVESLQKRIHRLQLEHDILKRANDLLKKDEGIDLQNLTNGEKTLLVDALRTTYGLSELLDQLVLAFRAVVGVVARQVHKVDAILQILISVGDDGFEIGIVLLVGGGDVQIPHMHPTHHSWVQNLACCTHVGLWVHRHGLGFRGDQRGRIALGRTHCSA